MIDAEMFMRSSMGQMIVPTILLQSINNLVPVTEIVHLGCGSNMFDTHIATLKDHVPTLERVYLYDPVAKYSKAFPTPRDLPEVLINVEPPVGTPAIALHPGFCLSRKDMFDIVKVQTEPWEKTLRRLNPSYLAFSSYSSDEMLGDLAFLLKKTNLKVFAKFDDPITENFLLSEDEGIDYAMTLMARDGEAIDHLENIDAVRSVRQKT